METKSRAYALVRPCPKCPFRTDVEPYIREDRAAEIASSIMQGGEFHCHQTTVVDPDDDSRMIANDGSMVCAGSLIVMEKQGTLNQMARVAERIGMYDPTRLDMDAPVHESFAEWQQSFRSEDDEFEPCNVVGPDCEAPAGFAIGGSVVEGTESAEFECAECGTPVCGACSVEAERNGEQVRVCTDCEGDNDDDA